MHVCSPAVYSQIVGKTQTGSLLRMYFCLCRAHYNHAAIFDSMSHFFSRDNVGLPGVSLYFKVGAIVFPQ